MGFRAIIAQVASLPVVPGMCWMFEASDHRKEKIKDSRPL